MTRQELTLIVLRYFETSREVHSWLNADIWPRFRETRQKPGVHLHNERLHAEAVARREAKARAIAARKEMAAAAREQRLAAKNHLRAAHGLPPLAK